MHRSRKFRPVGPMLEGDSLRGRNRILRTSRTSIPDLIRMLIRDEHAATLTINEDSVDTLCLLGLGPAAYALSARRPGSASPQTEKLLQGADMTARLVYQRVTNTVTEVVATLHKHDICPVLLKGISVAADYYVPRWSRVMGDVDILVSPTDVADAAGILRNLGFVPDDREKLDGPHHHLPAVRHSQTGIILELHTGLFPPDSVPASVRPFLATEWNQHTVDSACGEIPVLRFTPTFQLAYLIAHWATERKWPISVFPYIDAAHIIRDPRFDWRQFLEWMNNDAWFATCASLMISWLHRAELANPPAPVQSAVAACRQRFGTTAFRIMLWLIRSVPLSGRQRGLLFINHRAALAGWRSMLAPDSSGKILTAMNVVLRARLAPVQVATMRGIRRTLSALRIRNGTAR